MKTIKILLTLVLVITLHSCNNDDDGVSIEDRATSIIGQWEFESIMSDRAVDLNGDNEFNIDLFNTQEINQCAKDDLTTFTDSGPSDKPEFNVTESNLACEGNDAFSFVHEDFWTLTNDNTIISFENQEPYRIIEFTNNKLVVERDDIFDGLEYITTITYRKK